MPSIPSHSRLLVNKLENGNIIAENISGTTINRQLRPLQVPERLTKYDNDHGQSTAGEMVLCKKVETKTGCLTCKYAVHMQFLESFTDSHAITRPGRLNVTKVNLCVFVFEVRTRL